MIKKTDVIDFFDRCAPTWDAEMVRSDEKINIILNNAGVHSGSRVLDVACGTGVLVPDYCVCAVDLKIALKYLLRFHTHYVHERITERL